MNAYANLESLMNPHERPTDVPTPPPLETVANFVRACRTLRNWKVSTLADFAAVSVSTVERVERAERVSEEALDKIAAAFGREKGAFYTPRIPLGPDKAFEALVEAYGQMEEVAVAPMNTQRAIREAAKCAGILVHSPEVPEVYADAISTLQEWIDLASFVLCEEIECGNEDPCHPEGRRTAEALQGRSAVDMGLRHGRLRQGTKIVCGFTRIPFVGPSQKTLGRW